MHVTDQVFWDGADFAIFGGLLAAAIVLIAGLGYPWSGPLAILGLNGFFIVLFLGSAWLFRKAARGQKAEEDFAARN